MGWTERWSNRSSGTGTPCRRWIPLAETVSGAGRTPLMADRPNPLSSKELDVLAAVAQSMTNGRIARSQHCAEETVRSHLKQILRKLSARNRTHAVAMAYHIGVFRVADEPAAVAPRRPL